MTTPEGKHYASTVTYDVTAISHEGDRVPLTAGCLVYVANDIAESRSRDEHWSAVEVRESATGKVIAAYRDGEEVVPDEVAEQKWQDAVETFHGVGRFGAEG